jgi:hypothetical protein
MIILKGKVANTFKTPAGTDATGNPYQAKERVQVISDAKDKNGQTRVEILDVTVPDASLYADKVGKEIELPVSIIARQGKVYYRVA